MLTDLWKVLENRQRRWLAGMFLFGTGRGLFADYGKQDALFAQRAAYSALFGVMCTIPPYGVYQLYNLTNRLEVKVTGKNPEEYPDIYMCGVLATNPRVVW